jgi:hypothetical protein
VFLLVPGVQIVVAGRHTNDLGLNARIEQGWNPIVVHRAARPTAITIWSMRGWFQGYRQISPMNQVVADSVAPMDLVMPGGIGIILVKQMILASPLDKAIRII